MVIDVAASSERHHAPQPGAWWRVEWAGVLAVSTTVIALASIGTAHLVATGSLGAAIAQARDTMAGPVVVAVVIALFVLEQMIPAVRRPIASRAHVIDALYLVSFIAVLLPVLTVVETGFGLEINRHLGFMVLSRLPLVSRAVAAVVVLVAIDAINWVCHVANHRSATMWRLHALHHSQEQMSVFTTFRTHPLVHATYLPALLPALFLGASGTVPAGGLIAYGCGVALAHANVGWTYGPIGRVVVSPAFHRLHHEARPVSGTTANFGFVLSIWDQLARTARFPLRHGTVATGLADRPVPVEQELGVWRAGVRQLSQPFERRAATDGPR